MDTKISPKIHTHNSYRPKYPTSKQPKYNTPKIPHLEICPKYGQKHPKTVKIVKNPMIYREKPQKIRSSFLAPKKNTCFHFVVKNPMIYRKTRKYHQKPHKSPKTTQKGGPKKHQKPCFYTSKTGKKTQKITQKTPKKQVKNTLKTGQKTAKNTKNRRGSLLEVPDLKCEIGAIWTKIHLKKHQKSCILHTKTRYFGVIFITNHVKRVKPHETSTQK